MAYKIGNNCKNCGECQKECPVEAISENAAEGKREINPDVCIECGTCAAVCEYNAVEEE